MRTCNKCKKTKPLIEFHKHAGHKYGLKSKCKSCSNSDSAAWRKANPRREKAYGVARRAANPERLNAQSAAWRKTNPERSKANIAAWNKANPERYKAQAAAYSARRRASKIRATPRWADHRLIADIYREATRRQMEVDHIVPLRSKLVCGLHWEGNLQLLTGRENASKQNRRWPDMP